MCASFFGISDISPSLLSSPSSAFSRSSVRKKGVKQAALRSRRRWHSGGFSPWTSGESRSLRPSASQLSSTRRNPAQLLRHSAFLTTDVFILPLKLLRAHYLRGRNAALTVWWLHAKAPSFQFVTRQHQLLDALQQEGGGASHVCQRLSAGREPSGLSGLSPQSRP